MGSKYLDVTKQLGDGFIRIHDAIALPFGKGFDLEGYLVGMLETNETDGGSYEILYRIKDDANGEEMEIVSVYNGARIPRIDDIWEDIKNFCKQIVTENGFYEMVVNSMEAK